MEFKIIVQGEITLKASPELLALLGGAHSAPAATNGAAKPAATNGSAKSAAATNGATKTAAPAAEVTTAEIDNSDPFYTATADKQQEMIRALVVKTNAAGQKADNLALLAKYGSKSVSSLALDKYADFYTDLKNR